MTGKLFKETFKDTIRCMINLDRIAKENKPVEIKIISGDDVDNLYLPWYKEGSQTIKRKPLSVNQVKQNLSLIEDKHRKGIIKLVSELTDKAVYPIPAIETKYGLMILDGCHRVVASRLVGCKNITYLLFIPIVETSMAWDLEMMR